MRRSGRAGLIRERLRHAYAPTRRCDERDTRRAASAAASPSALDLALESGLALALRSLVGLRPWSRKLEMMGWRRIKMMDESKLQMIPVLWADDTGVESKALARLTMR